jgi:hypothetical protein
MWAFEYLSQRRDPEWISELQREIRKRLGGEAPDLAEVLDFAMWEEEMGE